MMFDTDVKYVDPECRIIPDCPKEPKKINDDKVSTRLLEKNYSPMIVRKYIIKGWPTWVAIICDLSLSDLDKIVNDLVFSYQFENDIQVLRNFCGMLSEKIVDHYNDIKHGSVEGVAVLMYSDKLFISSLYGDFMTHLSCRQELYSIIQTLPHI